MEWIGALVGAVATVIVAFIGLFQPRNEPDRLKQLAEARQTLGQVDNAASREVDRAIEALATSIRRLPVRRFHALGFTAIATMLLSLFALILGLYLYLYWKVLDQGGFETVALAALPVGGLGIYLGLLWLLQRWLDKE